MNRDLVLRRERPDDLGPTRVLHDLAFGVPDGAEHATETLILDRLRAEGDVLDALTLVADLHGEAVGHVVCSRATMGEGPSVALGPIAVHPDHQGVGIGSALVAAVSSPPTSAGSRRSSSSATRAGTRTSASRRRRTTVSARPAPGPTGSSRSSRSRRGVPSGRGLPLPPGLRPGHRLTWGSDLERPLPYR